MGKRRGRKRTVEQCLESRYAENWGDISKWTRALTGDRCCFPGCNERATATHHTIYFHNGKRIAGYEVPGIHVFPLCDRHHSHRESIDCAHHPANWIQGTTEHEFLDARNTAEYWKLLHKGWKQKLLPQFRR